MKKLTAGNEEAAGELSVYEGPGEFVEGPFLDKAKKKGIRGLEGRLSGFM